MRTWNLAAGDPLCLILAADARLGKIDYANDQIWNVNWQTGAPPALAVETTFGLRARSFRIFPRFSEGDNQYINPADFTTPPVVQQIFPNYIALQCTPIPGIDVFYEIWVPSSQTLAGRLTFVNQSEQPRAVQLDMAAQLTPNGGQRMASLELEAASVLSGITADLSPIVCMTGDSRPGSGSFPSLRQEINLEAKQRKTTIWTHAALSDPVASFNAARQLAFRNWEAEIARVEMMNACTIEFFTGNPDWDAAFKLSQKHAFSLIINSDQGLPYASLVQSRQPDQGYSPRGDGSDYSHLWNGQTPFDVFTLSKILLPVAPEIIKGLIHNFIGVQAEDGFIDFKPGIAQQRSRRLATPLLATLTWQIFQTTNDREFLAEVYPALHRFVRCWFSSEHDRDQDGLPEWDHPVQSGYEDHPLYAVWHNWSQGIEISCAESPSLMAFLIRELDALTHIAEEIKETEHCEDYRSLMSRLKDGLVECWDEDQSVFMDRDRDAHTSEPVCFLGQQAGPGTLEIKQQFEKPVRLIIKILTTDASTRHPRIILHGTSSSGNRRVEEIPEDRFRWVSGQGNLTGERIYQALDRIDIENIDPQDQVTLYTAGYQCFTIPQLLPLWSGELPEFILSSLINSTITNPERFWQPFGLPACIHQETIQDSEFCASCDPLWNSFIIEGLLSSGYYYQAADLFSRLMSAAIHTLKTENGFRHNHHPQTGQGIGDLNSLNGIPPVSLFLKLLGIQINSATRLEIRGENPFPWPVTVKYLGLTILRGKGKTSIIFPDGQTVALNDPAPQEVVLETT